VRAKTDELEYVVSRLAVDENEVGFDVAVAVVRPLARERMLTIADWQRRVCAEELNKLVELVRKEIAVLAPGLTLEITLEARG